MILDLFEKLFQFFADHLILSLFLANFLTLLYLARNFQPAKSHRKVFFLIAHPDDELMFFYPTILSLRFHTVQIICATHGEVDDPRRKQLEAVCNALNLKVYFLKGFQDTMDRGVVWDIQSLQQQVLGLLGEAGALFTFDKGGVSGHPNHISLSKLFVKRMVPEKCQTTFNLYHLKTVNLFRKYIGLFDLIFSLWSQFIFVEWNMLRCWSLMKLHSSQLVWYRRLYLLFSRYVTINTYSQPAFVKI